jgi:hypothetical protein
MSKPESETADLERRVERLKSVIRDLVDAIENGDAIPHHSYPKWDRVVIYAKSAAVSAAKDVTNEQ